MPRRWHTTGSFIPRRWPTTGFLIPRRWQNASDGVRTPVVSFAAPSSARIRTPVVGHPAPTLCRYTTSRLRTRSQPSGNHILYGLTILLAQLSVSTNLPDPGLLSESTNLLDPALPCCVISTPSFASQLKRRVI